MPLTLNFNRTSSDPLGMGELPMNGGRMIMMSETIKHDDGTQEVRRTMHPAPPSMQPFFWIPSFGLVSQDEMEYMAAEYQHERLNPTDQDLEWEAHRRSKKESLHKWYREACEMRTAEAHGNKRSFLTR